ncbi:small heat shock protein, chloroplastic-like isoform X2 [Coffea arabica]|uniref:Small heat shock protein, chloroplastic-like isoform X2 n=1 Tax=Coffea arabica TaxID=13443 RepID=A0ABM4W7F7_COFAR
MSHCLSNLPISQPHVTPQRCSTTSNRSYGRSSRHLLSPVSSRNICKGIRAMTGLWDRFPTARTVQQMMETMERLMGDPFAYSGGWPSSLAPETGGYSRGRTPWEIKESDGEYKMRFDMPGMTKEDVKVWVEEKMLVVKAEKVPKKKNEDGEEEEKNEWSAKSYGRYNSIIALPENVQFEKIKAEVRDGVLYITIPKASSHGKILDINVE